MTADLWAAREVGGIVRRDVELIAEDFELFLRVERAKRAISRLRDQVRTFQAEVRELERRVVIRSAAVRGLALDWAVRS